MIRFILFLSFVMVARPIWSQSSAIDSLQQQLSIHTEEDQMRVDMLNELARAHFNFAFLKTESLAREALQLAESMQYEQGIARANLEAGRACTYMIQVDQAYAYLNRARRLLEELGDTLYLADAIRFLGILSLNDAEYGNANKLFSESAALFRSISNPDGEAFSIMDIGIIYLYLSANEEAMAYYLEALKIAESGPAWNAIGNVKNSIGQLYYDQGKYEETEAIMRESLEIAQRINNPILISDCQYYLALVALKDGDYQSALELNAKSLKIDSTQNNLRGLAHKHILNGDIYRDAGVLSEAQQSYEVAKIFCDRTNGQEQTLSYVLIRMSKVEVAKKNYGQAIAILNGALAVAEKGQLKDVKYEAYRELSECYSLLGRPTQALNFLKKYTETKDEVINARREENFNRLQVLYEDEQKRAEIAKLQSEALIRQQEIELQEARAKRRTQQVLLLIVGIVALLIIAGILWTLFRNKSKSNLQLDAQKQKIEQQNLQKEILLKEIHHRVKNNLQVISSLLSLQSHNISDEEALSAVREGQNRVKSIALIHQKLYQTEDVSRVNFEEYVQELVSYLLATFRSGDMEVDIKIETHGIDLDIDTAVPLGLIINELVSNSFKYAFKNKEQGSIWIELTELDRSGRLKLVVEDDGIGLPKDFKIQNAESLGLRLVYMLCVQLDGEITFNSEKGSHFEMEVSDTELRKQME